MEQFAGKRALITGGATGIGRALALALADEGMEIVIASTNAGRLEAAAELIRARGVKVQTVVCDVSDREAVRAMAKEVGPVDLLCINAGVTTTGSYLEHRDEDYDWIRKVILEGVTNCIQAFYPDMCARGSGHIMITGSQTAYSPNWFLGHGPYVPAKAAVHTLALALRAEAAEHGVEVSLLIPAYTETDIVGSERARPASLGTALGGQIIETFKHGTPLPNFPYTLSAEEAAARAVNGIRNNAALIPTHAGMKPLVEHYFNQVLAAYDEAARFVFEPKAKAEA